MSRKRVPIFARQPDPGPDMSEAGIRDLAERALPCWSDGRPKSYGERNKDEQAAKTKFDEYAPWMVKALLKILDDERSVIARIGRMEGP